jgi:subtilisin family serine protease
VKVEQIAEAVSPRIDALLNSDSVDSGLAEQSAFVATSGVGAPDAPPPMKRLRRSEVAASRRRQRRRREPGPDVDLNVFVQLQQDLDPDQRDAAQQKIAALTRRARWKQDTAAAQVAADKYEELRAVDGVAYIEAGQTLTAPEPILEGPAAAPQESLRKVTEKANRHRYGRDVLVGIIDVQGFDFAHRDFRATGGGTRWEAIWDQAGRTRPSPADARGPRFDALDYGSEILKVHMDAAIAAAPGRNMAATSLEPQASMVPGSHGTHVASIAAGNRGVARNARLAGVCVALRPEDSVAASSFYDSTRITDAVDYLLALAVELGKPGPPLPVSINISLGTNGHAHDTSSAMARWIDNALTTPGRCISVAAGNAGQVEPQSSTDVGFITGRIHAAGTFAATNLRHELGWIVGANAIDDVSENEMEVWYSPQDRIDVEVKPPGGPWIGPVHPGERVRNHELDNGSELSITSQTYHPANGSNRISILLSPYFGPLNAAGEREVGPIASGEWKVRLTGTVVRDGRYDAWIERDDPRRIGGPGSRLWSFPSFFAPGSYTDDRMIGSLACAERLLAVANVDAARNAAHVTSSRGPSRDGRSKPDISAEGTGIVAAGAFDRTEEWVAKTGTSMASPYVCGVAALMLAIAPKLTSAQIVGIMRTRSTPLPGHNFAWRKDTGFGVIDAARCVAEAADFKDAGGGQ